MSRKQGDASNAVLRELRAFGLGYPGAHSKSPWPGHNDLAVNDKTFAYLSLEDEPFSMSIKLPYTSYEALKLRSPDRRDTVSARRVGCPSSRLPTDAFARSPQIVDR
jgi:hypothetical protein